MFKIADFNFEFSEIADATQWVYRDFKCTDKKIDFTVACTKEEIYAEKIENSVFSERYLQSVAYHRKIAEWLPTRDAFVLHSACFDVDGVGVAFAAHSGTGKTTHMTRWMEYLGDRMTIVNGDKPIVRFFDEEQNTPPSDEGGGPLAAEGEKKETSLPQPKSEILPAPSSEGADRAIEANIPYAYGTPWNGKEKLGCNMRTPLKHICFIERSETNYVEHAKKEDVIERIFNQVYMPKDPIAVTKTMELIDRLLSNCSLWIIHCNMDENAGKIAYKQIFNKS